MFKKVNGINSNVSIEAIACDYCFFCDYPADECVFCDTFIEIQTLLTNKIVGLSIYQLCNPVQMHRKGGANYV